MRISRSRKRANRQLKVELTKVLGAREESEQAKVAESLGLVYHDKVSTDSIDRDLLVKIPFSFARENSLLPVKEKNGSLLVLTSHPERMEPLGDLRLLYGMPIEIEMADEEELVIAINSAYDMSARGASDVMDDINTEGEDLDTLLHAIPEDLLSTSAEAPVIRLVNSLLVQAAKENVSDIHIEPFERELVVRFRVDGILRNIVSPPKRLQSLIISRVKVMAELDIAEKRLPQDGRLKIVIAGKEIDIRVSTIPTSYGERVVMRLLSKETMVLGFDAIGMKGDIRKKMEQLIRAPHGVILVSGPTGSGKTTTLYTALSTINDPSLNIITVEDPVEYQLAGIGQMQVNPKIELTFATGLRSILRQDPDIIMVGEIRDSETAQIAVQAALTGHLVFSTIHTNDSAGAITRLVDMGTEPFLIASSLIASLAQRLVRRLCPDCSIPRKPADEEIEKIGELGETIYDPGKSPDCKTCGGSGYKGRIGLYELLPVDDDIRGLIVKKSDSTTIRKEAEKRGFRPMRLAGAEAIKSGITSVAEVVRVTTEQE